ncbi:hypothetical protein [Shewanella sp. VB17]|uniref:hypothetical protein n=1 Tax=Shewanella sp. VB17 TaxID=2739432 RepID=UPI001C263873|nr:hypothetical protein [Shewanella sp. VB17]
MMNKKLLGALIVTLGMSGLSFGNALPEGMVSVESPYTVDETAIDLPQKALFWQDETGKVWLSYHSPEYLQQRHNVSGCDAVFDKIGQILRGLSSQVVSR